MATKTERHRIIVKRTVELLAASFILGATSAIAIALTADGHTTAAICAGLTATLAVWLTNRVAGALFAELGIGS